MRRKVQNHMICDAESYGAWVIKNAVPGVWALDLAAAKTLQLMATASAIVMI
jgi:hypothetical protein